MSQDITIQTFPGVYVNVLDNSFPTNIVSRYSLGVTGVASKGPMNVPTRTPSVTSFVSQFGKPVTSNPMPAQAVAAVGDFSDGTWFNRVGHVYSAVASDAASVVGSGSPDPYKIYTSSAKDFQLGDYIRIVEAGKISTVNARVSDYIPSGNVINPTGLQLVSTGPEAVELADDYVSAFIDRSEATDAASNAESFLSSIVYGDSNYVESAGFVTGSKTSYSFDVDGFVGPLPITSLVVSSGVATLTMSNMPRYQVGDYVHIANAAVSGCNGEFVVLTSDLSSQITFNVPGELGPELLTGEAPVGGYVTIDTTPGASYDYTNGVGETLINGAAQTQTTGTVVAQGSFIRVYTSAPTATGSLKLVEGVADGTIAVADGATAITVAILAPGDLIKIVQTSGGGRSTTYEAMVQEIIGGTHVNLYPSNVTNIGYQAVSLQDNYSAGNIYKAHRDANGNLVTTLAIHMIAASAGTWANSDGVANGLWVTVSPGANAGTKKLLVYVDGTLVETIDNLSMDSSSTDYFPARINGLSQNIAILTDTAGNPIGMLGSSPPANTMNGWSGASQKVNFAVFGDESLNYGQGFDGEVMTTQDVIGTLSSTGAYTGLRAFTRPGSNYNLSDLICPGITDLAVHQEMILIATKIFAEALIDSPSGINGRQIVDWSNGAGDYSGSRAAITAWQASLPWNWISITDPFTGNSISIPPTIALARQRAFTFDHFKPWYAASGVNRGVISIANSVEFATVDDDTRNGFMASGQSITPILDDFGQILVWGDRTLQRTNSKLIQLSVATLVNYLALNIGQLGRKYIFDPNDQELIVLFTNDLRSLFEGVKSDRGISDYNVAADNSINTPEVQNQHAAIVNVDFIPFGSLERLYVNLIVDPSGATITNITG